MNSYVINIFVRSLTSVALVFTVFASEEPKEESLQESHSDTNTHWHSHKPRLSLLTRPQLFIDHHFCPTLTDCNSETELNKTFRLFLLK